MNNARMAPAPITGFKGAMVKRFAKKMLGEVPDPLGIYWHNPQVLSFFMKLGQASRKWNACDENLKSFAHMAVASQVGCTWCLDFGYFMAHNEGLDLTKAREVPRWRESDVFTPLERDVLAYAEAMTNTPTTVTDELFTRLREALGEAGLVELSSFIAVANVYTRTNTAFGIEAQGFAAACGLKPLAEPTATAGAVRS